MWVSDIRSQVHEDCVTMPDRGLAFLSRTGRACVIDVEGRSLRETGRVAHNANKQALLKTSGSALYAGIPGGDRYGENERARLANLLWKRLYRLGQKAVGARPGAVLDGPFHFHVAIDKGFEINALR